MSSRGPFRDTRKSQAKLAPCIIFVDEVDALLGRRDGGEHEALRELKNEFMAQWDGVRRHGVQQRVTVLGATNRPQVCCTPNSPWFGWKAATSKADPRQEQDWLRTTLEAKPSR